MEDYVDSKLDALGQNGTLNAHPEDVTDDLFSDNIFLFLQAEINSITSPVNLWACLGPRWRGMRPANPC